MPWCDGCDRFLNPNTVREDGRCPGCGRVVARPSALRRARRGKGSSPDALAAAAAADRTGDERLENGNSVAPIVGDHDDTEPPGTPWHFKLLVVALIFYLAWRLIQGILWVSHKL